MSAKIAVPNRIDNSPRSIEWLGELQQQAKPLFLDELILDFTGTAFFEAHCCAGLGAVLSDCEAEVNTVVITGLKPDTEKILRKNQFLTNYGFDRLVDSYDTTVPYQKFSKEAVKSFKTYIDSELLGKASLPTMSQGLKKRISESLIEIFLNAGSHSGSDYIFCCGQYFPNMERLDFSIANTGRTFSDNVNDYLGQSYSGAEAIEWAVQEGHTTRDGEIPGGLGLATIRKFVELNQGKIQIVSADGGWTQHGTKTSTLKLRKEFQGSVVTFEINMNDKKSYSLKDEQL